MATPYKKPQRTGRSQKAERTVVYRGIKIAPIAGKRSATSKALNEALRDQSGSSRGGPARG